MSMPKGRKFDHGYATVTQTGMGFREIAEIMTKDGDQMNHATARNVMLRALSKISGPLASLHGAKNGADSTKIAIDPRFQEAMMEIISQELKRM